jgi:hypothetical protein
MQNTTRSLPVVLYHRTTIPMPPPLWPCAHAHLTCPLPTAGASCHASRPMHLPPCHGPCLLHMQPHHTLVTARTTSCAPHHCMCHITVPSSLHTPCCHAPHSYMHHLTVPIAAAHPVHLTTTATMTVAITPQQHNDHHDVPAAM